MEKALTAHGQHIIVQCFSVTSPMVLVSPFAFVRPSGRSDHLVMAFQLLLFSYGRAIEWGPGCRGPFSIVIMESAARQRSIVGPSVLLAQTEMVSERPFACWQLKDGMGLGVKRREIHQFPSMIPVDDMTLDKREIEREAEAGHVCRPGQAACTLFSSERTASRASAPQNPQSPRFSNHGHLKERFQEEPNSREQGSSERLEAHP
ncbi:hypothetical protein G7054_g12862 [Neopestalotiopsis clavispora]|nr:hypothetical protein G7054_g12862 [Neopestalotiopsis clavispora]